MYRRLSAVNSRKRNIDSCCVACCSLLCNYEERYCCITAMRYYRCTVHSSEKGPPQFIQKYNLGNSVPNIVVMLRIFLTIPVSVVTCESFSKLKLIKNCLRSSMSTLWLRNFGTLTIEQQLTDKIHFDIALEEFANKKDRKVTV